MMSQTPNADREVYFEFTALGSAVRVSAIDSATGVETVVVGPANASAADLERLALNKLRARLAREGKGA
jgi:hypothetical protein